jgi:hypothetical protein
MVLLNEKVTSHAPDYMVMLGAGGVKYIEERLIAATPLGNANFFSGLVKGGIGFAAHHFGGGNKIADMIALGFTVDAVEDVLQALMGGGGIGGMFGGGNASANNW